MQNACFATVILALAVLVPAPPLPAPQSSSLAGIQTPCPNPIEREPVVLYEVSGGTLVGVVDYFLTVYSDGSARLSSFLGGAGTGSSQFVSMDPSEVEALRQALTSAGALLECDAPDHTSDTPLQTLTLFRAGSTRRSNTFSWFTNDGNLALVQSLLDGFIAAHFVPPPSGGGS
jgi:hypothetical protein